MKRFGGFFLLLVIAFAIFWSKRSREHEPEKKKSVATQQTVSNPKPRNSSIPDYVLEVYHFVIKNHEAPDGYVGGRIFQNREKKLPQYSASHERMSYQEWDVHPKERNKNRGAERLITDQEHHGYYTKDHYRTFQTITE